MAGPLHQAVGRRPDPGKALGRHTAMAGTLFTLQFLFIVLFAVSYAMARFSRREVWFWLMGLSTTVAPDLHLCWDVSV